LRHTSTIIKAWIETLSIVLAIDPGAERCGYAIFDTGSDELLIRSGILDTPRNKEDFQPYRMALEERTLVYFDLMFDKYAPDLAVNEIIPAVGGGNFSVTTQSYLTNCVVSTFHNVAFMHGAQTKQVAARSVQAAIAVRGKSKKISKVQVRNGVIERLPQLRPRIKELVADETDAIAIGLYSLDQL
jgi:Holliday junction resolvasome RuvABC endonuclease subunit